MISDRLLVVEGKDDYFFFENFLKNLNINDVDIRNVGGKDDYKNKLPLLKKTSGFDNVKKIAIIIDAHDDCNSTFKSIYNIIRRKMKLIPPKTPNTYSEENPSIGIFIMPDNCKNGSIEDLCLNTIKSDSSLKCIDIFIECIKKIKQYSNISKISKRKVQIYLSVKPKIPNSLGLGAKQGYWDFSSKEFDSLKKFLSFLK